MKNLALYLILCNFKVSSMDHSLFVKHNHEHTTIVLVYVGDIIITGNNKKQIKEIKNQLRENFDIKDLGHLKFILGIEIAYSQESLFLSQRKYILELLKEIKKLGCKSVPTPFDSKNKLNIEDDKSLEDISQYQRFVGKLIYLTVTRPDITYAVSQISQYMHVPRTSHMEAINKILRYLKRTPETRIFMKNNNSNEIYGYTDAD
jgi:Reverse transcriptase (RNA-dependent DNA polymerase)